MGRCSIRSISVAVLIYYGKHILNWFGFRGYKQVNFQYQTNFLWDSLGLRGMSKWILVFLCCFAANAFASSADSGRCPWKIPFTIIIHGVGNDTDYFSSRMLVSHGWKDSSAQNYGLDTIGWGFTVDTARDTINCSAHFSLFHIDSQYLRYQYWDTTLQGCYPYGSGGALEIAFAPGKDSIRHVTITDSSWSNILGNYDYHIEHLEISSLKYDDTSIYSVDSAFSQPGLIVGDTSYFGTYHDQYNYSGDRLYFTASSVDLSGIFRPMHFADQPPAIVVQSTSQAESLSVISLNGVLQCSFDASSDERTLEFFSVLGVKAASCDVSPGQTEAVVPHISPGFYFVRLGSLMAKVYVAE